MLLAPAEKDRGHVLGGKKRKFITHSSLSAVSDVEVRQLAEAKVRALLH